jgi:hypothetical protein
VAVIALLLPMIAWISASESSSRSTPAVPISGARRAACASRARSSSVRAVRALPKSGAVRAR